MHAHQGGSIQQLFKHGTGNELEMTCSCPVEILSRQQKFHLTAQGL